jgi:hypothetical protein
MTRGWFDGFREAMAEDAARMGWRSRREVRARNRWLRAALGSKRRPGLGEGTNE